MTPPPITDELMQAITDFVSAADWDASQSIVEAKQALLFAPEVQAVFEQHMTQARRAGDQPTLAVLEQHRALLRDCQASGIEAAFAKVKAPGPTRLPFAADLMPRSLAALLGSPQDKLAHAQYLAALAGSVTDPDYRALVQALQAALVGGDLAAAGQGLRGIYAQAWQAMTAVAKTSGVEPEQLDVIVHNTQAVLTRAPDRQAEWRASLAGERSQTTAEGMRPYAAFLDAVMSLLDAGGDPAGLGTTLEGIFAEAWQRLVKSI